MFEVVWPVADDVKKSREIRAYELPGGKMARAIHKGPYETSKSTHLKFCARLEENKLRITGLIREIYQTIQV